tara:strand:- start:185 stop:424 length:240 start_codon:yes stop_codon:yes gene_type:complete
MNPEEFSIGDLVEDGEFPGSQGIFTDWGYNGFEQVCGGVETKIAIVTWIKHEECVGYAGSAWRIWTNELILLAKGKQNV